MNNPGSSEDGGPTREQAFAQAFAATANHAVSCITTDLAQPYVDQKTQQWFGRRWKGVRFLGVTWFAGCDHSHAPKERETAPRTPEVVPEATPDPPPEVAQPAPETSTSLGRKRTSRFSSDAVDPAQVHSHADGACSDAGCGTSKMDAALAEIRRKAAVKAAAEASADGSAEAIKEAKAAAERTARALADAEHAAHCPHHGLSLGKMYAAHFASDIGAVPLALVVQRYVPQVNHGIRYLATPLEGAYRKRAHRAAIDWAAEKGIGADAAETKAYEQRIFEYEIGQALPNGIVWGALSLGIDPLIQRYGFGSRVTPRTLILGGLNGAVSSSLLVFEARLHAPGLMQRLDRFNGDHLVTPVTRLAGQAIGLDTRELQDAVRRADDPGADLAVGTWTRRSAADGNDRTAARVA